MKKSVIYIFLIWLLAMYVGGYQLLTLGLSTSNWLHAYGLTDLKTEGTHPALLERCNDWEADEEFQKMCQYLPDNPAYIEYRLEEGRSYVHDWDKYLYLNKYPRLDEIEYTLPTEPNRPIYFSGDCTTQAILFANILGAKGITYRVVQTENFANFTSHVFVDYEGRQDTRLVHYQESKDVKNGYKLDQKWIVWKGEKIVLEEESYGELDGNATIVVNSLKFGENFIYEGTINEVNEGAFLNVQVAIRRAILVLIGGTVCCIILSKWRGVLRKVIKVLETIVEEEKEC